jgi:PHD/YefM family antitoxin component YafN of YafNO toxin-antitoxin module
MTNWRKTRVGKLFAQAQKSDKKGMENKEKEPTFQENISLVANWYKNFYLNSKETYKLTSSQIELYQKILIKRAVK